MYAPLNLVCTCTELQVALQASCAELYNSSGMLVVWL